MTGPFVMFYVSCFMFHVSYCILPVQRRTSFTFHSRLRQANCHDQRPTTNDPRLTTNVYLFHPNPRPLWRDRPDGLSLLWPLCTVLRGRPRRSDPAAWFYIS